MSLATYELPPMAEPADPPAGPPSAMPSPAEGLSEAVPPDDDVIELDIDDPDEEPAEPIAGRGVVPATIAAVVFHVWLLATLQNVILPDRLVPGLEPVALTMPEEPAKKREPVEEDPKYTLANPNDKDLPVQKVLNATSVGVVRNRKAEPLSPPDPLVEDINPELTRREVFDIPEGVEVSDTVVVKGTTGQSIIQLESALDRVTHEIALNLMERKVLVIWMLDASASLQQQRDVISRRLRRIYGELEALKDAGQIPKREEPLLTGVVSFGATTTFLTRHPTVDFDAIQNAVQSVQVDQTGRENVFTAVVQTMNLWGRYRTSRRILLITVTDESGDDFAAVEPAIAVCRRYGARAYVIGPSAVFGRRKGYVPYVAPENGRTYQIPVDLGPETARYENVLLPFWFEGPQYRYLSSGYGPYGLSRLVRETGGIYFTTNTLTMRGLTPVGSYRTEQIKPFEPDYRFGTPKQYDADLRKHPFRAAIVRAAVLSRQNKPDGTPQLELRVKPRDYRRTATKAQETAARTQLMVETILQAFPKGIEKQLDREPSPRWRMNFCLTYGRLLALRVRALEYNSALADLKSSLTPQDVGQRANHWIFRPDDTINYATTERRSAQLATELLRRCVREAPGTPWARLAERELRHGLGLRVVKRFIPPPPPRKASKKPAPRKRIILARTPKKRRPRSRPQPKPAPPKLPRY